MAGNLGDNGAGPRGGSCARHDSVLPGVPAGNVPEACDRTVPAEFETLRALASGLEDASGVVGIHGACVGPVEAVYGRGQEKAPRGVPLETGLIIREPLRLHLLSNGGQRRELVARARQE